MKTEFINRELATVIKEASKYFSVITVTGPRQSGKTTLLQNIFSELHYFSLENLDIQNFAVNDPVAFLNQYPNGMILDEVHNAPALLSYIQGIVDADPQ
ncbi:MAG: AAA family ATPase, partial [Muribaculaceae bacterium]